MSMKPLEAWAIISRDMQELHRHRAVHGKKYTEEELDAEVIAFHALQYQQDLQNRKNGLTFGTALEALKHGAKIARKGWNGKGMFLLLADGIDFSTQANLESCSNLEGDLVLPSLVMKTEDDHFSVGWLASQSDLLAEDWFIV